MIKFRYSIFIILYFFFIYQFYLSDTYSYADDIRITPVVKAVENTKASVVNISTYEQVFERNNPFSRFGSDPFFDSFLNNFFNNQINKKSVRTHLGSGVIIDSRGYVLTNWHVVEKAAGIVISTEEENEFNADLVGADPKSDLAVLKIDSKESFSSIPLGVSDNILIGETVIAIGNPFGLSHSVTTGVVSALHRSIKANEQIYENFIQTDASINPGNSGGPLLNIKGELIGINTAIYSGAEGIGFAIPISTAKRIIDDLLEYGEVHPPWLGISVQDMKPGVAEHFGYKGNHGVIISEIFPGSPADKAGVQPGDIILSLSDQKIKSKTSYKRILGIYTANDTINIKIYRQGSVKTVQINASEMPVEYLDSLVWDGLGIKIIDNSNNIARRYNLYSAAGVVISEIKLNSTANKLGLAAGDIILKVQTNKIKDTADFKKQILNNIHRESVVLLVQRGRYGYYVNIEIG